MNNSAQTSAQSVLANEIISIVDSQWNLLNSPLPLSRIGQQLGPIAMGEFEAYNASLKNYILNNLSEDLRYIENSKYGDLACPRNLSRGISDSELVRRFEARHTVATNKSLQKKFKPAVWNAFITPSNNNSRYIIISTDKSVRIETNNTNLSEAERAYPVEETDLAFNEDGSRFTYAEARARIINWSERYAVEIDALYDTEPTYIPTDHTRTRTEGSQKSHPKNQQKLLEFLAILTDEERRRISIPADIVHRLLKDI